MGQRETATVGSLHALAKRLGVHARTVERWSETGEMPVEKSGRYHVAKIQAWRSQRTSRNRENGGAAAWGTPPDPTSSRDAKRRDELREARVAELKLKIREREMSIQARQAELVPRDEVGRLLRDRGTFFRRQLLALARNLAQSLARESEPIRVQQMLEAAVLDVLEHAYEHVPAEYRE